MLCSSSYGSDVCSVLCCNAEAYAQAFPIRMDQPHLAEWQAYSASTIRNHNIVWSPHAGRMEIGQKGLPFGLDFGRYCLSELGILRQRYPPYICFLIMCVQTNSGIATECPPDDHKVITIRIEIHMPNQKNNGRAMSGQCWDLGSR